MKKHLSFLILCMTMLFTAEMHAQIQGTPLPESMLEDCVPYVPNAFTPNGDNINDLWGIRINPNCDMVEFNLQVYDRWGRKVFDVDGYQGPNFWWDGTYDGEVLPGGVYVWQIVALFEVPNGPERVTINKQGTVALIR